MVNPKIFLQRLNQNQLIALKAPYEFSGRDEGQNARFSPANNLENNVLGIPLAPDWQI